MRLPTHVGNSVHCPLLWQVMDPPPENPGEQVNVNTVLVLNGGDPPVRVEYNTVGGLAQ